MNKSLLIVSLLLANISVWAQLPSTSEYEALMDLYSATNGSGWTNNTGWSTANPNVVQSVAGWHGVQVDQQGHVTVLNLGWNNLTGNIPASIGDLTYLEALRMNDNQISNSIPSSVGSLTALVHLHLHYNLLTGALPSTLGGLTNLTELILTGNKLTGSIPSSVGSMSNLAKLQLSSNLLTGSIPTELGNLSTLKHLNLGANQLTGAIPNSFGQLTELEDLYIDGGALSGSIPSSFGGLVKLKNLVLRNHQLTGPIPAELGDLESLQIVYLDYNQLGGPLPSTLGNLSNLIELDLTSNLITGAIPPSLGNLNQLTKLSLQSNELSGSIPASLGDLDALTYLNLRWNNLSGAIPPAIGNLASITNLAFDNNELSGSIPASLGNLTTLRYLWLWSNQFSGNIPAELGGLTNLWELQLQQNSLSGPIPGSLGNMTSLAKLALSNNGLTDSIPSALGNLANLIHLELSTNQLSGKIPPAIGNLTNLVHLDLTNNQLTGIIPNSIGNLDAIHTIWLDRNKLSGLIPETLGNLTTLNSLSLWRNELTGTLPASLASLPNLYNIRVDGNRLNGIIPPAFASQNLTTFVVSGNRLTMEDLLEAKEAFPDTYSYMQQDSIDSDKTLLGTIGNPLVLTTNIDRNTNPGSKYEWIKFIPSVYTSLNEPSESAHTLTLPPITAADLGAIYYYRVTNDALPGLVLYSRPQTLALDSAGECGTTLTQEFNALLDLYESTNGPEWLDNTGWRDANRSTPQRINNWYGVSTDANGHVGHIDLDGSADWTTITNAQGYQVYTGNNLDGTLPTSIGNFGCLRALNVGGNHLTGAIPEEIGQLTNLTWLVGSTNQFTGNLPASIGNLTKLDRILMELNQLSGPIPPSIGNLKDLWALLLNNNQLTGPIPQELGRLKKLRFFYLYNNMLSGSIPDSLGNMTAAYRIGFQNNQLTGSVPASLSNLSNLQLLYLSNNKLEGSMPAGLSGIAPLQTIVFNTNKFTFSSFIDLKNSFTGTTFAYQPQDSIDVKRTLEGSLNASVTLTTSIDRNTTTPSIYQWFRIDNGVATPLNAASAQGHTHVLSGISAQDLQASFYYTITNNSASGLTLRSRLQKISVTTVSTADMNYIKTTDVTVAGKMSTADIIDADINERIINYTYFDGLGRPVQSVQQQVSPSGNDIVTPISYDEFGRETRKYLPIVVGNDGAYKLNSELINAAGDYIGAANQFYSNNTGTVAADGRPFSETVFEASPLNRPMKSYGPGTEWKTNEKSIQHQYLSNVSGTTGAPAEEDIIAWKVSSEGLPIQESNVTNYVADGRFLSGQVYIKVTIDENGNAVREYTNKQGQVVLKKVQVVAGSTNLKSLEDWASTYYIYDDLGNLRYVLPPEGVKRLLELEN